ncbi:MAG: hypothetical protein KA480_03575 [Anaerolineales bacterium]|nr:hypothetical protein [Anaerolineales bacterium]
MPLFDFFKKPSKKEEPSQPQQVDKDLMSPEMQQKRYEAAMEFVKELQEKIPLVGGRPHAGTVLAIAARLAGTNLYRSMNYKQDVKPGTVVLSEEVNQAWPQLMNLFAIHCKQNGMDVLSSPLVTEFPQKDKPLMTVEQVQLEYQDQYDAIMKKHGLDHLNAARAGMMVAAIAFQYHCVRAKDIDPRIGTGIVAMGVVEGAKTAPPPLGTPNTIALPKKNNARLVLGEDEAAAREARENGGVFIQLPPGMMDILKAGNMAYAIYEKALIKQIESQIPRIDFVEANVDELFAEWRSKPEEQAPVYVRLIVWLKKNASAHGYEQDGNSWVKK